MSQTAGPLDYRERYSSTIETMETHLDGRQMQIHTALPGHIVSYNATTMTASVQVDIQAVHEKLDGKIEPVTIKPIADVPVHFPGGGGHIMTFPVNAGDECLVIFAERAIDNWFQHGGTQLPSDYRMHDINDAFVLVGTRSQPKVPANVNATTVQLRSDDGKTFVQLDGKNNSVALVTDNAFVSVDSKARQITLSASTVVINGEVHVSGEVWGKFGSNPVSLTQHIHKGNNQPPNVGTMREDEV